MAENENTTNPGEQNVETPEGMQLVVQTIYAKDVSFEAPNSPSIFLEQYKPDISVNLNNRVEDLENDSYEVELQVTVTSKVEDKTAYIAEVKYGAVFGIKGMEDEVRNRLLRTFCCEQLFPYVREAISESISRGGFPRFVLQPINFNALYEQAQQQAAQQQGEANA
ncbi:protein-export chaperone SecB [Kangiella sediminilitoris]|uniref:Protein-export protein SecB n=1 Tax=Kangiella sediminilitoris TaxID=1144748 RepID=A0A1B3B8B1_9GAMM|nr:protein-export chaperone SecB [Kangiella sediminilitoris]AOE49044.1 Protein-export protein SecB [Kangiella sediminilitoris]